MSRLSGVGRAARYRTNPEVTGTETSAPLQAGENKKTRHNTQQEPISDGESEDITSSGEPLSFSTFRPDREGVRKVLGDLEADVMEHIWSQAQLSPSISVREVFEALAKTRPIAYTTVMNTMSRLARKQLLKVHKEETAYFYSANFTQAQFIETFIGRILDDLLVSFGQTTRTQLEKRVGESERERLEEIKRQMEELRRNQ